MRDWLKDKSVGIVGILISASSGIMAFLSEVMQIATEHVATFAWLCICLLSLGFVIGWYAKELSLRDDKAAKESAKREAEFKIRRMLMSLNRTQADAVAEIHETGGPISMSWRSGRYDAIKDRYDVFSVDTSDKNYAKVSLTPEWNFTMNAYSRMFYETWK